MLNKWYAPDVFMEKKHNNWVRRNAENSVPEFQSPDEQVRDDAVCGFCPCHAGWEKFEAHVGDVLRMLRDPSQKVRAHAQHVFDDAARMQLAEDLKLLLEPGDELTGEKRSQHLPSIIERFVASRNGRIRESKRRHRLEGRLRKSKIRYGRGSV